MKFVIEKKMSNTGSIHDLASDCYDRVIVGRGKFAVVLAAYYGGRGYTTHLTEEAAIKRARLLGGKRYSYQIIDAEGNVYYICEDRSGDRLVKA